MEWSERVGTGLVWTYSRRGFGRKRRRDGWIGLDLVDWLVH